MAHIHSFPPIAAPDAEILILGSMPGKASLRANQYYAHPRNAFWPIMATLFGLVSTQTYAERCDQLRQCRVAVWDVLKTCTRSSSLDSDIDAASVVPNNFPAFFDLNSKIRAVYFNGAMAEKTYVRHVVPMLPESLARLAALRVPSTSPANAALSYREKLEKWQAVTR